MSRLTPNGERVIGDYERRSMENREALRQLWFTLIRDDPILQAEKEELKKKEEEKQARRIKAAKIRAEQKVMRETMEVSPRRSRRLLSRNGNPVENQGPLIVKFWKKSCDSSPDWSTYADEDEYCHKRKRRTTGRLSCAPVSQLKPEDVTDEHIKNIASYVSTKVYSADGSTCHQCRQKTLDTKTVCRSQNCVGIRGQFCGVCLKNRYGESVEEALKDPNWSCPPCRGFCNCSICRTRDGKRPTGQLYTHAVAKGYKSVLDYLQQSNKNNDEDCD